MRVVLPYVSICFRFLARAFKQEGHSQYAAEIREEALAPRVNQQASDERSGVGGVGRPVLGSDGSPDTRFSRREHGVESHSHVGGSGAPRDTCPVAERSAPSITDNRGNGALLNKLVTSRYPLSQRLSWTSVNSSVTQEYGQTSVGHREKSTWRWAVSQTEISRVRCRTSCSGLVRSGRCGCCGKGRRRLRRRGTGRKPVQKDASRNEGRRLREKLR